MRSLWRRWRGRRSLTVPELIRRVGEFPRWHYEIDLGQGLRTPIYDAGHRNRHRERKRHFFDPLVRLCGGSLRGKRVLDLGCNAGFWSLCAIEAGCDFVLGVDGRRMHIEQSNLVFQAKGVSPERYRFDQSDVFDLRWRDAGPFDIVLCLGLLYHVSRPIELLSAMAAANSDLAVIDTTLVRGEGPTFRLAHEDPEEPLCSVGTALVLRPTAEGVIDIARALGYRGVVLEPHFADYTQAEDFRDGTRRAFLCAKRTDLSALDAPVERRF